MRAIKRLNMLASLLLYCSTSIWVVAFAFGSTAAAQENDEGAVHMLNSLPRRDEDISTSHVNSLKNRWSPSKRSSLTTCELMRRNPPVAGALSNLFVSIIALPVLLPFIIFQGLKGMFE